MANFTPTQLNKSLTPIESVEWRSGLVQYMKTHINEILTQNRLFQERELHKELSEHDLRLIASHIRWLASELARAEMLLWDNLMEDFADKGQKLFWGSRIPDNLLSRQSEFWLRNFDLHQKHPDLGKVLPDGKMRIVPQALLLLPDLANGQLSVYQFTFHQEGKHSPLLITDGATLEPGYVFPSANGELCDGSIGLSLLVTTYIEFLKSTIIGSERESLPRLIRRQAERTDKHEPIVRVIHLRRAERKQSSSLGGTIEYQHQWLVRPHWRNQYYSSSDEHKPVFIDAYIKGPEDKPFKPPKDHVFKVDR